MAAVAGSLHEPTPPDSVERLWRTEWSRLDARGRGAVSFGDLPQLLEALGVDLTEDELEDAAYSAPRGTTRPPSRRLRGAGSRRRRGGASWWF